MAQAEQKAKIVLMGQVDNSFTRIGTALTEMGGFIDQLGSKLIDFGKESVNVYKDYEYNMRQLEGIWSTNGTFAKGSKQLRAAMTEMNTMANQWAEQTIFHTNDVSNALVEAAHAGWDYEQMMTGIPAAMQLALAGSMDLSEGLDYLIKAGKALQMDVSDLPKFVDMWVYSANRSAGTAQEFGETFLKMGSTMQFADNIEELMALTKVMHDMGTTGSAAGTLVRNSMLRLLAPSGVASKTLTALGATEEEIKGIMEDASKKEALNLLESYGFSAYDAKGESKPILQIYSEFGSILANIAGGWDKIAENKTTMGVLANIFGVRAMTGAVNIIHGLQEAQTLFDELKGGAATGTGEYLANIMQGSLYGQLELFESKIEALKNKTGEVLSEKLEGVLGWVGGIVDDLNAMDDDQFNALVNGLIAIAGTGVGLSVAGMALRTIGILLSPAGLIATGAVALTSVLASINALNEAKFEDNFGLMDLDKDSIKQYIHDLGAEFQNAHEQINGFKAGVEQAVESYQQASSDLSSIVMKSVLTKEVLSAEDVKALYSLGDQMQTAMQDAVLNRSAQSLSYWEMIFGGPGVAKNDPAFQEITRIIREEQEQGTATAKNYGNELRDALFKAWNDDNQITPDERAMIEGTIRAMNDAIAEIAANEARDQQNMAMRKLLKKAQTVSWEDLEELGQTAASERDRILKEEEDTHLEEMIRLENRGASRETMDQAEERYRKRIQEVNAFYDEFLATAFYSAIESSDQGYNFARLLGLNATYRTTTGTHDTINYNQLESVMNDWFGQSYYAGGAYEFGTDREHLGRMLGTAVAFLGGAEEIISMISHFEEMGNYDTAETLRELFVAEQFVNNFGSSKYETPPGWDFLDLIDGYKNVNIEPLRPEHQKAVEDLVRGGTGMNVSNVRSLIASVPEMMAMLKLAGSATGVDDYNERVNRIQIGLHDYSAMLYYLESLRQTYDTEAFLRDIKARGGRVAMENTTLRDSMGLLYEMILGPYSGDIENYRRGAEVPVSITVGDNGVQTYLAEANGTEIETKLTINTSAFDSKMQQTINKYGLLNLSPLDKYATGGRANLPSIFGEAGPEWAIPEEHTGNTAALLLASMYASGFSLAELAGMAGARMYANGGRSGSLNWSGLPATSSATGSGSAGNGIQVQYSPVIHADNANGVDRVLREDKKRLESWMEGWWDRRQLYQSMVSY